MIFKKDLLISPDGTQVDYVSDDRTPMRVTASKHGISISESPVLYENAQLQRVAKAIADAFKDHLSLKRTGKPWTEPVTPEVMAETEAAMDRARDLAGIPRPPDDQL